MPHKYANDEERRATGQESKKFCRVTISLERSACNGTQHEEAPCTTDTLQRLLENTEQHTRVHAVETEHAQARTRIFVSRLSGNGGRPSYGN